MNSTDFLYSMCIKIYRKGRGVGSVSKLFAVQAGGPFWIIGTQGKKGQEHGCMARIPPWEGGTVPEAGWPASLDQSVSSKFN